MKLAHCTKMKYPLMSFLIGLFCSECSFSQTGGDRVTYESKVQEPLQCDFLTSDRSVLWFDRTTDNNIFQHFQGDPAPVDQRASSKHDNFNYTFVEGSFTLNINGVQRTDVGDYRCRRTLNDGSLEDVEYSVIVEVLPSDALMTCTSTAGCPGPDETSASQLQCTCEAIGVNPQQLQISWVGSIAVGGSTQSSDAGNDLYNLESTATVGPTSDNNDISCTVTGYAQDVDISTLDPNPTTEMRTFSPPSCTISFTIEDDCAIAVISCDCDSGYPEVDSYIFYDRDNTVIGSGPSSSYIATLSNLDEGDPVTFRCRRCNGVNYGAVATLTESCSLTTTQPLSINQTNDCKKEDARSSSAVLIMGWTFAAVLVVVLIFVIFYFWRRETVTDFSQQNDQKSHVTSQRRTGADNSAYMDLKDRAIIEKKCDLPGKIPEQNVNILSDFPSGGLMVYRKVKIDRNSRHENAVAKSLSDAAPITLLKLWYSEVTNVLNLPKQYNVVEVIGWCNAVPHFLLTELVIGGNLLQHLSDHFSPHKLHQYGNTKSKKYGVPEKGNPDDLPKYALDVSRGLRFLLGNKFIHPGLRAEKVLLDSAGRCKLYDIVSSERAKAVTSLLWRDSVPYQWLSPEYLLLGTMSPAGDIWSFGVMLWEIFSYGSQPYPGEDRNAVENSLRRTDRLSMPQNCPGAIWQLMILCWEQSPEMRPKLEEITTKLSTMCNDSKEYEEIPNQRPLV